MRKIIMAMVLACAAMPMAACTTAATGGGVVAPGDTPAPAPAPTFEPGGLTPHNVEVVNDKIEAVASLYSAAKSFASLFTPYLPDAQQKRVAAAAALVEKALSAARVATDLAAKAAALTQAEGALATFKSVAGA